MTEAFGTSTPTSMTVVETSRRADHKRLAPLRELLGDPAPGAAAPPRLLGERHDERLDRLATCRQLRDGRDIEVTEHRHRDRARDGRRREHEQVRRQQAFCAQGVALLHAESVLLVDDDEPEVGEEHALAEQCVGADDDRRRS